MRLEDVCERLTGNIAGLYGHWLDQGFGGIRARWLEQVYGLGKPITARMADRKIDGMFEGIDAEGNLVIAEQAGQTRTISSGAVHFRVS